MKYYNNYVQNLAQNPHDTYMGLEQASINDQWDNTTQVITVFEQDKVGSEQFHSIEVRVDTAIDMGTSYKQDDDFKLFAFRDLQHTVAKGLMYKYDNDFWITINTSELGTVTKDIHVRRCNNVMRWLIELMVLLMRYLAPLNMYLNRQKSKRIKMLRLPMGISALYVRVMR